MRLIDEYTFAKGDRVKLGYESGHFVTGVITDVLRRSYTAIEHSISVTKAEGFTLELETDEGIAWTIDPGPIVAYSRQRAATP